MQGSLTNIADGLPFGWIGHTAMLAADAGADVRGAMADAGISGTDGLVDEASPIGPAEFLLMCRLIINAVEDEMHGAARSRMLLGTANMVVRAMASSRTLHEAIETAVRFFVIAGSYCRLELRVDEDVASLAIRSDSGDLETQPIVEEMFMSFLHIQLSHLLGFLLPVARVGAISPRHPGVGRPHPYMLGRVVRANVTGFSFPADYLAFPCRSRPGSLPRLEAELAWIARHGEARSGAANLDEAESRSGDVYRHLLAEDRPFDDCAGLLRVSPSELRRDLWLEGSTFRTLRRAALVARARPLLRQGRSVDDLAEALGYSDGRSFRRPLRPRLRPALRAGRADGAAQSGAADGGVRLPGAQPGSGAEVSADRRAVETERRQQTDGRSFRRALKAATGLGIAELRDLEAPLPGGARDAVLAALRREEIA